MPDDLPEPVRDPREWLRFGVRRLPLVGAGYGFVLALADAILGGGFRTVGLIGFLVVLAGAALGLLSGVVTGAVVPLLVGRVERDSLRWASTAVAVAATGGVCALLLTGALSGPVQVLLFVWVPAALAGRETYEHSPAARRITG